METDDNYSPELEAQDPFFNRATQAELRRRILETPISECIPFDPNDPESRARVLGELAEPHPRLGALAEPHPQLEEEVGAASV
jgi:hypothetical protein